MSVTLNPAIRANFGEREYYITTMKAADAARNIKAPSELFNVSASALDQRMQRHLSDRVNPMVDYLNQDYRFYGPLVVAIRGGEPNFIPLEMAEPNALVEPDTFALGVLRFEGTEDYFVLDGQHRLESIKQAIAQGNDKTKYDDISLVIIRHEDTVEGVINTRRIFTHLNRYAKPTTNPENYTMDEDDGYAIVTRQLVREHPVLKDKIWYKTRTLPRGGSDDNGRIDAKECFTTLETAYNCNRMILQARHQFDKNWERVRPDPEKLDKLTEECTEFWDSLQEIEPINLIATGKRKCSAIRKNVKGQVGQGHLLFRPVGLEIVAEAITTTLKEKEPRFSGMQEICQACAKIDWRLDAPPWNGTIYGNDRMLPGSTQKRQRVGAKLLRYMLGTLGRDADPDLLKEYRELVYATDATSPEAMQLRLPKPVI